MAAWSSPDIEVSSLPDSLVMAHWSSKKEISLEGPTRYRSNQLVEQEHLDGSDLGTSQGTFSCNEVFCKWTRKLAVDMSIFEWDFSTQKLKTYHTKTVHIRLICILHICDTSQPLLCC